MSVGNAKYNMLYNPKEKHYVNYSNEIDINDLNNSLSLVLNAIDENSKVLDVGCSFGYIGEWLIKNKNCKVYGIDIDSKAIAFINSVGVYEGADCINLDYALDNGSEDFNTFNNIDTDFDYVICADLLEHLKDPSSILKLLGTRLSPGGKIIVSIPNIANIDIIVNLLEGRFNYSEYGIMDNTHLKFFTFKSFLEWIYTINSNSKDFIFDLEHLAVTKFIPEYTQEIRKKHSELIDTIININPDLENLQNIFLLTKIEDKDTKSLNLLKLLKRYKKDYKFDIINEITSKICTPVSLINSYEYIVKIKEDNWCGLEIMVATFMQNLKGIIELEITEEGQDIPIVIKEIDLSDIKDNTWVRTYFSKIDDSMGKSYAVRIRVKNTDQSIAVWLNEQDVPCFKLIFLNDDFSIENAEEENTIIEKLENKFRPCLVDNSSASNGRLYNSKEDKIVKLENENKRLRNMVKELLDELI